MVIIQLLYLSAYKFPQTRDIPILFWKLSEDSLKEKKKEKKDYPSDYISLKSLLFCQIYV